MKAWVVVSILAACEQADERDVDCPPEAIVERVQQGSGDELVMSQTCAWADRRTIIETDAGGVVVGRRGFRKGELDGLVITRERSRNTRSELSFRLGVPHGASRNFVGDTLVSECHFIDGVRDGVCWASESTQSMVATVRQYDHGRRTGVWSYVFEGRVIRSWVYGDDVLLASDGRPLPLPPVSIEMDGDVIVRRSCGSARNSEVCTALFDTYQFCESDEEPATCRTNARQTYRTMKDRVSAKDRFRRGE